MLEEPYTRRVPQEVLQSASTPSCFDKPLTSNASKAFDIRYPALYPAAPAVVQVLPRIQVELPASSEVQPPQTCRDILRLMSIQKQFENRKDVAPPETNKWAADEVESGKKKKKKKTVVAEKGKRGRGRRSHEDDEDMNQVATTATQGRVRPTRRAPR